MTITFDKHTPDEAKRFNTKLARVPRFGMRHRVMPLLLQGLLRLSQFGADRKLRRAGLLVEGRTAVMDGLRRWGQV